MPFTVKSRYSASALHFTLSLIVFSLFIFVLLHHWFPEPYFSTSGGWQGLKIVAAVDLILGPLLTLIIYNINKPRKELIMDLSLIAALQLGALFWGISTVYTQRPLAVTFWEDKFYSISAEHFPAYNIEWDVLEQYGDSYPVYIYVQSPVTEVGKQIFLSKVLRQSIPPNLQPELYRPLSEHYPDVFKKSIDITEAMENNPDLKQEVNDLLNATDTKLEDNYYMPLKSNFSGLDVLLIFNKNNNLIGHTTTALDKVLPDMNSTTNTE